MLVVRFWLHFEVCVCCLCGLQLCWFGICLCCLSIWIIWFDVWVYFAWSCVVIGRISLKFGTSVCL